MFEQKEKINLPVELPLGEDPVLDFWGAKRRRQKHWEDKEEEGQLCVDVAETAGELVICGGHGRHVAGKTLNFICLTIY